jgi:heterodisulfide reductase subunit A
MMALKHANLIKERYPQIRVNICYIDIRTTGIEGYENWYDMAREREVIFIPGKPSEITQREDGKLIVHTEDMSLGEPIELESDLVILSAGIESSTQTKNIAALLNLRLNEDGFIKALDPKVRALATERWGIFMCGGSRGPTDIPESILQANAAVSIVGTLLSQDTINGRRMRSEVDTDKCNGCEVCQIKCPFNSIIVVEKKAKVNEDTCRGCGVCASNCPTGAAQLMNYSDEQIFAQIEGILSVDGDKDNIIGFICRECGYASSDLAGVERFSYPENINLIDVPCLGRISVIHILKAIELNAKGVALIGCMPGRCQCNTGNNASENVALAKEILRSAGRKEKVNLYNFCGAMSHGFAKAMNEFAKLCLS